MNGKEPKAAASNGKKVEAEAMDEAPKATKRGKGKKAQEQDVEETAAIEIIYDAPKATKSGIGIVVKRFSDLFYVND